MGTPTEMVYAGAIRRDGEVVHAYYIVHSGTLDDRAQLYPMQLEDVPPGAVCKFIVLPNGTVQEAGEYLRIWPDQSAVHEWTSRHNAVVASEAAWQARELPEAFSCLEPIRAAYRRLDAEQQGVLIAQVVRYIATVE